MKAQPQTVPGTPLDEKDFKRGKAFTLAYSPKLHYAWDTGEAIGRYLAELKRGRLIGRRCCGCERVMIPPRSFCEGCFRATDEWVYLKDMGTVNTFSLCYVSWDVRRLKRPEIPAVIEIDGASPGMGILHVLKRVDPKDVAIGMRVKAVWKPSSRRTGSITDIAYWMPVEKRTHPISSFIPHPSSLERMRAWPGEIPIRSLYTVGVAGQIFFRALKERGELVGTRCTACDQTYVPPRCFCERCFTELTQTVEIKPEGRLVSFTICYLDRDERPLRQPVALALVRLDGATTCFLHRLINWTEVAEIAIGARVKAVMRAKRKRKGSILDIEGFRLD
jgi:uncharacterized protein